jgi:hypothetical protein
MDRSEFIYLFILSFKYVIAVPPILLRDRRTHLVSWRGLNDPGNINLFIQSLNYVISHK